MFDLGKFPIVGDLNFGEKFKSILTKILMPATEADKTPGSASGAFIVNRPTYLPESGIVVGENKGYAGGGLSAAVDGRPEIVQMGGGETQVFPLGGAQAQPFIEPVAKAIAGQSLNQMAMERVGMQNTVASAGPTIVDSSTNTQVFNETNIRKPSVDSPSVYGESTDRMMRNVA